MLCVLGDGIEFSAEGLICADREDPRVADTERCLAVIRVDVSSAEASWDD